jgi:photosystem II stability/assembly factor-like uncharacterized protein
MTPKNLRHSSAIVAMFAAAAVFLLLPGRPAVQDDAVRPVAKESRLHETAERDGDAEGERSPGVAFYYMSRLFGNPGVNVHQKTYEAMRDLMQREGAGLDKTSMQNQWTDMGPANIAGRIRAITFHPTDANVVLAGAASGGVFKSTDQGRNGSWRAVMDFAPAIPVGAITYDPTNPDIVYAGTGEPTMDLEKAYGAPGFSGIGVMKSTDGGETWNALPWPKTSSAICRILVDPRNTSVLFVGARDGLWRTSDGGQLWTRVRAGTVTDAAFKPDNPDIVYCALGNDDGGSSNGVYISTTGGTSTSSFTKATANMPASDSTGRIILGITPADPNLLVAFMQLDRGKASGQNDFFGIWKSTNTGTSWERLSSNLPVSYTMGQGFYNFCLAISPTDKNVWLTGGYEAYRSSNGGTSWSRITNGNSPVHVDQHVLTFTSDAKLVYLGNDGGIYRSTTTGSSWTSLAQNLRSIQFYTAAYDFKNPAVLYGGVQDHGIFQMPGDPTSWRIRREGDGGYVAVDPSNSNILYCRVAVEGSGLAVPARSSNGGQSWTRLSKGLGTSDRFNWLPPLMLSPQDRTLGVTATQFVYTAKSVDLGDPTWTPVSADLSNANSYAAVVSTVAMCESNAQWMWAGTGDGNVHVTQNVLATSPSWTKVSATLPTRWVTRIAVDYQDPMIAYVGYSGYGIGHVWKTTDAGASWTNISGDLPDVPVNSLTLSRTDRGVVFAATDVGVWYTRDNGVSWARFGDNLPNVVVYDVLVDKNNRLIAATHGRGMWTTTTTLGIGDAPGQPGAFTLSQNYPNPVTQTSAAATMVGWELSRASSVRLTLSDEAGRIVRTLAEGFHETGRYEIRIASRDLQPGVYFYSLTDGRTSQTRKLLILR